MYKIIFTIAVLWSVQSQVAFAGVERIGDWVEYKITYRAEGSSNTEFGKMKQEITDYNPAEGRYLVRLTVDLGDIDIHDDWIDASEIFVPGTGSHVVKNCVDEGGSLEKFDLNGTTYDACKKYWAPRSYDVVGDFPVDGRVRFVNLQETNVTGELIDFHFN